MGVERLGHGAKARAEGTGVCGTNRLLGVLLFIGLLLVQLEVWGGFNEVGVRVVITMGLPMTAHARNGLALKHQ